MSSLLYRDDWTKLCLLGFTPEECYSSKHAGIRQVYAYTFNADLKHFLIVLKEEKDVICNTLITNQNGKTVDYLPYLFEHWELIETLKNFDKDPLIRLSLPVEDEDLREVHLSIDEKTFELLDKLFKKFELELIT